MEHYNGIIRMFRGDSYSQPIKINIGSFDFQVVEKFGGDELITISNLKGIINERNKEKDIYGLCIGVKNKTSDNVKVVGIEVLNRKTINFLYFKIVIFIS